MVNAETVVISIANIGAVFYMVKRIVAKVDQHSDMMPQMMEAQRQIAASLASVDANQTKLWASRDDHDKRLTRIETVHEFHGCNVRTGERG